MREKCEIKEKKRKENNEEKGTMKNRERILKNKERDVRKEQMK